MKKSFIYVLSAAAALFALSGCEKSAVGDGWSDRVIRVAPEVETKASCTTESLSGFDLLIDSPKDKYDYTNTKFTKDEAGNWVPAAQMLWENKGGVGAEYLAVSPSLPEGGHSIGSTFTFYVEPVQTLKSTSSDLLLAYGKPDTDGSFDDSGRLKLNFNHALSLLRVELTLCTEFNHNGIPATSVVSDLNLYGFKSEASVSGRADIGYSVSAVGNASTLTAYQTKWTPATDKTQNCKAVFECIVVPQSADSFTVSFIAGDTPYNFKAGSVNFKSGNVYTLSLTVGKDEVISGGNNITTMHWNVNGNNLDIETY